MNFKLEEHINEYLLCILAGLALLVVFDLATLVLFDNGLEKKDVTTQHIKNIDTFIDTLRFIPSYPDSSVLDSVRVKLNSFE